MAGQMFGRYLVESTLGEGGMGVVFKARDPQLARTVAIKVLPPDTVVDADRKRRFVQEARAASALNHPNIVTIYDIGADGDTDFIVMEYVPGATLDRRIPPQGMPVKQALAFGIAIADALAKAHEAGIVHRDLKPSNVIVTDAGGIKILDFGVARLLAVSEASADTRTVAATEAGTVVGTPAYMSPEQAEGRPVDARSDIFSFGSVLYEMVTGRQAFTGSSSLSVLAKILNEEPAPPGRMSAAVPPELEKAILRCLRKDPARRYQTMADLKVALEDLVAESSPVTPVPPVAPPPPSRWKWAVAVLVPLLLIAVFFAARTTRTSESHEAVHAIPLTSLSGQVRYPSFSPDGNHVAFTWSGATLDNPDVYVQQIGAGSPLRLTTDPAGDSTPAWAPDGRAIAFLRRQPNSATHELRVVPPLGGPERKIAEVRPRNPVYRPLTIAWCPDSSCVVVPDGQGEGRPDALFVIALDGAERRQVTFPPPGVGIDSDPAISPDGLSLVFRRDVTPFTSEMYRLPLAKNLTAAGEPIRLTDNKLSASRPAWMPDSREIVFTARGGLWRLDAFSGGAPARLPYVGVDGAAPTISRPGPDGRLRLVYVRVFTDTNLWRVDTPAAGIPASSPPRVAIASTRSDHLPALSPDDTRIAFFSGRSGEFELWVADTAGSNAVQLTSLNALPGFPRWSPDGETLAFHSDPEGHPDVLTMPANGGTPRILMPGPRGGGYPSFSRDGRSIYFAGPNAEGHIRIQKMPVSGGAAVELTSTVGAIPIESYDGLDLYYLEAAERPSALWRLPVAGGAPEHVLDGVLNGAYDVVERGIYYIERASAGSDGDWHDRQSAETRLQYFDFATRRTTTVARDLGAIFLGLTATRDGRTIFFARVDSSADELMLVEQFR